MINGFGNLVDAISRVLEAARYLVRPLDQERPRSHFQPNASLNTYTGLLAAQEVLYRVNS